MSVDKKETKTVSAKPNASAAGGQKVRYLIVGVLLFAAFLGSYRYAAAKSGDPAPLNVAESALPAATGDSLGSNCACCGSSAPTKDGLTGDRVEGRAVVEGEVQKISVDLSKGYYDPNAIVLKAGVPAEITFGQGSGCTAQVMSNELGFAEDLSAGPRTVKLPALEKGEYPFYCGMQMVFGKVVVE